MSWNALILAILFAFIAQGAWILSKKDNSPSPRDLASTSFSLYTANLAAAASFASLDKISIGVLTLSFAILFVCIVGTAILQRSRIEETWSSALKYCAFSVLLFVVTFIIWSGG